MDALKGLSADEVLEEIGFSQEHWLYTWFLDTTGLRWLALAIERQDVIRAKDTFVHPYPWFFRLAESRKFETYVGFVIAFNSITIGVQASVPDPESQGFQLLEHFFITFFLGETFIRVMAYGWTWLFKWQNTVDFSLVFFPMLNAWVFKPLDVKSELLRKFQILRIFRMVRLVRMVRTMPQFREMWVMLRGLIECGRTLLWTYVMITALLFLFSIIGVDFIANDPAFIHDDGVQDLFGTLPQAMFTLLQVMTLDSWTFICRPMMKKVGWVALFYIALILLIVMVLLNLITAVIVENAFAIVQEDEEAALKEKEKQKEEEIEKFGLMFHEMDTDGNGTLSYKEFIAASETPAVITKLKALEIEKNELDELWDLLDDGHDAVTIDEFCEGLRKVQSEVKAKEIMECIRKMRQLHTRTNKQRKRCKLALEAAETMLDALDRSRQKMSDTILLSRNILEVVRRCEHWSALVPHMKFEDKHM